MGEVFTTAQFRTWQLLKVF